MPRVRDREGRCGHKRHHEELLYVAGTVLDLD